MRNHVCVWCSAISDRDGDGHIEPHEIKRVMANLGCPQTDEQVKKLIQGVDTDGNGMIEFDEFIGIMASRMLKVPPRPPPPPLARPLTPAHPRPLAPSAARTLSRRIPPSPTPHPDRAGGRGG